MMSSEERFFQKAGFWRLVLVLFPLILSYFAFRRELVYIWAVFRSGANLLDLLRSDPAALHAFGAIFIITVESLVLFVFLLYLSAQFVLPVRNAAERSLVFQRIIDYLTGFHGPAVFIQEGKQISTPEEMRRILPGVAFVDASSAIVLEKQLMPVGLQPLERPRISETDVAFTPVGESKANSPLVRVKGPGLVFINMNERIRGVVDLRRQFRINLDVKGQTCDGIEVKTNVWVNFSLSQPPEVLKVAYTGERPEDIHVVLTEQKIIPDPGAERGYRAVQVIKKFSDELDDIDKNEIHRFAQHFMVSKEPSAEIKTEGKRREYPPYSIDPRRIFAAVYSQARNVKEDRIVEWSELPAMVATETFRNRISRVAYDSLYMPDDPKAFPLIESFKPSFSIAVRNQGVLSFQFLHRWDEALPGVGQALEQSEFRFAPVQELRQPKVLRERGIKVLFCGFSQLKPTNPAVIQRRLETWRARWQRETEVTRAYHDLEVMRIRNRARAQAQREMILTLSQIFEMSPHSEEAMAMRIFQALENAAADPATRQLLPRDTIQLL
ncbi:MAG: hypothetical protein EHM70_15170, partial [Chloroflexota bacterium]